VLLRGEGWFFLLSVAEHAADIRSAVYAVDKVNQIVIYLYIYNIKGMGTPPAPLPQVAASEK
jgi:hypothetical protein